MLRFYKYFICSIPTEEEQEEEQEEQKEQDDFRGSLCSLDSADLAMLCQSCRIKNTTRASSAGGLQHTQSCNLASGARLGIGFGLAKGRGESAPGWQSKGVGNAMNR